MTDAGADKKKVWTEEERLALATKLDSELDGFIDSLEKKRYAEGWPEDRWQEEMEKHPFFMKEAPKPGDEVHPMLEGLQKLKFDPEENSEEELALNYKADGNFYMQHKKFNMAVFSFTEAIKAKCENPAVQAVLYNNRSAAHFFLKNYRSSLADAQHAIRYNPEYTKAQFRAAQCAYELGKSDLCMTLCEELLEKNPNNEKASKLLGNNATKKIVIDRNQRREAAAAMKRLANVHRLIDALKERAVKFDDLKKGQSITQEFLRPKFQPLEDTPVHLGGRTGKSVIWPAAFLYPEFLISDFKQQLPENVIMEHCLNSMLVEPMSCDKTDSYRPGKLSVYYENRKTGRVHKVNLQKTIRQIIAEKDFFVTGGSLLFYVVPTDSLVETKFLNEKRRPMQYP